ncbi:MAG: CHAT domain-containing protein [Alphaproteobacteria bacterium]|nr:CHAT domain-containing protein [Alphaproteobacteria bacterium]
MSDDLVQRLKKQPRHLLARIARQAGLDPEDLLPGEAAPKERVASALVRPFEEDTQPLREAIARVLPGDWSLPHRPWWDFGLGLGRWACLDLRDALVPDDATLGLDAHLIGDTEGASARYPLPLPVPLREHHRLLPWVTTPGRAHIPRQHALDLGQGLGRRLDGRLLGRLQQAEVQTLRVRTVSEADAAQLLPWEILVLPELGPRDLPWRLSPKGAVLREVLGAMGRLLPTVRSPVVLFAWSQAGGGLNLDGHRQALLSALPEGSVALPPGRPLEECLRDEVRLIELSDVRSSTLTDTLQALEALGRPARVLHLLAHGARLEKGLDGVRLGTTGTPEPTTGEGLGRALASAPAPALLSLFACQTDQGGFSAFGPLTPSLVRHARVPTLASQKPIDQRAAVHAAEALYASLFSGGSLLASLRSAALAAGEEESGALTLTRPGG